MRSTLMKKLRSFRKNEDGVTLVEYGVGITLAVILGTGTLRLLAADIDTQMDAACDVMTTTAAVGSGGC